MLLKQYELAYNKIKFETDIYFEGKAVINGKRKYVSKKFKDWLNSLLESAIPYAWNNEIIKFFMKIKNEIE